MMATMKNAMGGISDQIADAAGDIGAMAQEQAKRGLKHARANVSAVADTAQSQASSLAEALEDRARERPLFTVALALGLGFLVGVAWRR